VDGIDSVEEEWWAVVNTVMNLGVPGNVEVFRGWLRKSGI
jgi:hypothetical protein